MRPKAPQPLLRLSYLPIDLLGLPIMLILLALMPVGYALSALCLLLLPVLWQLHREGALRLRLPGLIRLGLMCLCLMLSVRLDVYCQGCSLSSQLLWLGWFALWHILHYGYKRLYGEVLLAEPAVCCCSLRRRQALATEYRRFDRILLWFTLVLLGLSLALLSLAQDVVWIDRVLSGGIALSALGVILFELIHLGWVVRKLSQEHWLSVYADDDTVLGRVPSTHPRTELGRLAEVRLVAFSGDMIYLERGAGILEEAVRYDTPFRAWIAEGHAPQEVAQGLIDRRFCGIKRATPLRLLRYHHEEDGQPLLVYLYAVEVEAPDLLQIDCLPSEGKWWPLDQLAPLLEQTDFSPYLRSELPLLEQTALLAYRLRQQRAGSDPS